MRAAANSTLLYSVIVLATACGEVPQPQLMLAGDESADATGSQGAGYIQLALTEIASIESVDEVSALDSYRLLLQANDPNCSRLAVDHVFPWQEGSMTIPIPVDSSCTWLIGIQIGSGSRSKLRDVYFSSFAGDAADLVPVTKDKIGANLETRVRLRMYLTEKGEEAGYRDAFEASGAGDVETSVDDPKPSAEEVTPITLPTSTEQTTAQTDDGKDQGDAPSEDDTSDSSALNLYKASSSRGVEKPVTWMQDSHPLRMRLHGNAKSRESEYVDIWLAKILNSVFEQLYEPPFNIRSVSHMGIYNYRNISGTDRLSRHSYALAIDISAFTTDDGEYLTVEDDWSEPLMKDIRDFFCEHFDVVLSPDYNAAHHDHFHLDLNPDYRSYEPETPAWDDLPSAATLMLAAVPGEGDVYPSHSFGHGLAPGDEPTGFYLGRSRSCR